MGWLIVMACILTVLIYLFFAPLFVEVDSTLGLFRIRFHRLTSACLKLKHGSILLDVRIAGWRTQIDVLKIKREQKQEVVKKKNNKRTKISFQKIFSVVKSFRVRKFLLHLDTGDLQLNGILYPLFAFLKIRSGEDMAINFQDENQFILQLENNMARILWAYIRS